MSRRCTPIASPSRPRDVRLLTKPTELPLRLPRESLAGVETSRQPFPRLLGCTKPSNVSSSSERREQADEVMAGRRTFEKTTVRLPCAIFCSTASLADIVTVCGGWAASAGGGTMCERERDESASEREVEER